MTTEEQIPAMSEAELDSFPHGIIRLDRRGTILFYNVAQSVMARMPAANAIGLNFFEQVAPCSAVRVFQGRFVAFIATSGNRIEQFEFLFRFSWGAKAVTITLVRRAGDEERIYLVVSEAAA